MEDQITVTIKPPEPHCKKQQLIMSAFKMRDVREIYIAMGTKFGKAQCFMSLVPTTEGMKYMKDITPGDYVFSEHGEPVKVLSTTDLMLNRKCYDVIFSDGSSLIVDEEHDWVTTTHSERKNFVRCKTDESAEKYTPKKRTTKEILDSLLVTVGGKKRPNHSISLVANPVQFPSKEYLIKPYTLGVWLGDGSRLNGTVTNPEAEIKRQVELEGYSTNNHSVKKLCPTWSIVGLSTKLKEMNLLGNKHVPQEYLFGSAEQRLALLQGLMDTDGTISKRGDCTFDNTNKSMADAVFFLANSLGIKCTRTSRIGKLYGVEKKLCYRIYFTTDLPVFRLFRKAARLRGVSDKAKRRYITAIYPVSSRPVKCITVDNPTSLYLAGESFLVTHNSVGASTCISVSALETPGTKWRWIAPIYDQAKVGMDYVKRILPPKPHSQPVNSSLRIYLPKINSEIQFCHTKDPVSLEGAGIQGNIHDEAAKQPYSAVVSARTTTTFTQGPSMYISTPYGKNWFYTGCMEAKEEMLWCLKNGKNPRRIFLTARTEDNPLVPRQSIIDAKHDLPDRLFRQYYLAEFVDDGSVFVGYKDCVFGPVIDESSAVQYYVAPDAKEFEVVIGADWAKNNDFTVFGAFSTEPMPRMLGFMRFQNVKYTEAVKELYKFGKKFKDVRIVKHDKTGVGEALDDMMAQLPFPFEGITFTNQSKSSMVGKLIMAFEKKELLLLNWPEMLRELESYEISTNDIGTAKYSAPQGKHDDIVSMLMLANQGLNEYSGLGMELNFLEDLPKKKLSVEQWYTEMIEDD